MIPKFRIVAGLAIVVLATTVSAAPDEPPIYEPLPILRASDFIPASMLKGPNFEVEEKVVSDGVFNTYRINSSYANFSPHCTSIAMIRIHEIGAIDQLKDVDKMAVAAGAAVDSVVNMGMGAAHLVTNPVETAEGVGSAVSRLFARIGRGAENAEKTVTSTKTTKTGELPSTPEKVVDASGNVAKDLLGVNRAIRSWAHRLSVDPYTTNPILMDELQDVAHYDAGGRFATHLLPFGVVGTVLGTANTVNNLVWKMGPSELRTLNEKRLKEMGVGDAEIAAFEANKQYNLTLQTRLVASLDFLKGVTGRPEFVAQATGATTIVDARFYQEGAYMAEIYHRTEAPVIGIVTDLPGACVKAKGNRFACLYPFDYLVWTESVAGSAQRLTEYAQTHFPKGTRELWLTGTLSERSAQELKHRHWDVHPKGMYVLPARPATKPEDMETPTPASQSEPTPPAPQK